MNTAAQLEMGIAEVACMRTQTGLTTGVKPEEHRPDAIVTQADAGACTFPYLYSLVFEPGELDSKC